MGDGAQTGAAIDGAVVVTGAQVGLAGVERQANPQRRGGRPRFAEEGRLEGRSCSDGVRGTSEDGEAAVPLAAWADDMAAVGGDGRLNEGVMPGQGGRHGGGMALPEGGAALDIGEQKGEGAGRQVRHRRPRWRVKVAGTRPGHVHRSIGELPAPGEVVWSEGFVRGVWYDSFGWEEA